MFVFPSLKLNTTEQVAIPKPSEIVKKFGFSKSNGVYSGDNDISVKDKVSSAAEVEKLIVEDE